MRKWQSLGSFVVLGSVVACATATNSGAPAGNSGGTDSGSSSGGTGGNLVTAGRGGSTGSAGTSPIAGTSAGGQTAAFGGTGGLPTGGAASGGAAGTLSTGGASGAAGAHSGGSSGTSSGGTAAAGTGGAGTAGAGGATSTGPCMNPVDVTGGQMNNLGAGDVCLRTTEKFNHVGCSNFAGRTLTVNGMPATCDAQATYTPIGGFNYLEISAGGLAYASVNWYCSLGAGLC